jgi:hypothetical protein
MLVEKSFKPFTNKSDPMIDTFSPNRKDDSPARRELINAVELFRQSLSHDVTNQQ